jgi:hypothetical protein
VQTKCKPAAWPGHEEPCHWHSPLRQVGRLLVRRDHSSSDEDAALRSIIGYDEASFAVRRRLL